MWLHPCFHTRSISTNPSFKSMETAFNSKLIKLASMLFSSVSRTPRFEPHLTRMQCASYNLLTCTPQLKGYKTTSAALPQRIRCKSGLLQNLSTHQRGRAAASENSHRAVITSYLSSPNESKDTGGGDRAAPLFRGLVEHHRQTASEVAPLNPGTGEMG